MFNTDLLILIIGFISVSASILLMIETRRKEKNPANISFIYCWYLFSACLSLIHLYPKQSIVKMEDLFKGFGDSLPTVTKLVLFYVNEVVIIYNVTSLLFLLVGGFYLYQRNLKSCLKWIWLYITVSVVLMIIVLISLYWPIFSLGTTV